MRLRYPTSATHHSNETGGAESIKIGAELNRRSFVMRGEIEGEIQQPTGRQRSSSMPLVHREASSGGPTGRARPRKPESLKRSPFPGWLPKGSRTATVVGATQIPAYIRAAEDDLGLDDRVYIRRKLGRRLGKFAGSIERVSVRTEDVNGPRGGADRVCRIKVVLKGMPSVLFETRETSLNVAVDGALAGVERAVRRTLQRRRTKPLRRGPFMQDEVDAGAAGMNLTSGR